MKILIIIYANIPKYQICNALHENSFAPKIKIVYLVPRRARVPSLSKPKLQRNVEPILCMYAQSLVHSIQKQMRPPRGKRTIPCIHWSKSNCATHQVPHVAQPKADQSTTLVRFEHVPRRSRGVRLRR